MERVQLFIEESMSIVDFLFVGPQVLNLNEFRQARLLRPIRLGQAFTDSNNFYVRLTNSFQL